MSTINYGSPIPNNVGLADDRRLQKALAGWRQKFDCWWRDRGPEGFQADHVYLRTALSADTEGWAQYDYVAMPDYRWGIYLAAPQKDRRISFGDHVGQPVWQELPGELRYMARRLIVVQGDVDTASVEQQRLLGKSSPSLYDLRNLFQVNVEEARHLWAMVYLLFSHFGSDGRDEADALLERNAGDGDKPRILGAANAACSDWLHFYMLTYFSDRDGKYQLMALAESGFDPLSRTAKVMLTEEAHHLYVGETGIARIVQRTAELMKKNPNEDARAEGGIDLPTIQRYINHWYPLALDLFGGEISSNAANYFAVGLKGRIREHEETDHVAIHKTYAMEVPIVKDGVVQGCERKDVPLRNAMNEVLRDGYIADVQRGLCRWNKILEREGIDLRLTLPSRRFNRHVGIFYQRHGHYFDPSGATIDEATWLTRRDEWLPTASDEAHVQNVMATPVHEAGRMAHWIAPPARGVRGRPIDFEYVKRRA